MSKWKGSLSLLLMVSTLSAIGIDAAEVGDPGGTPGAEQDKPKDKKKAEGLPLTPARKIDFTTDEGTWISLDVSYDGKNIVFDLLGDLYTMDFGGGEAKKITAGLAFNSQPHFSPDGRLIAFLSDRDGDENLWIAKVDGSGLRQLTKDEHSDFISPAWTPDGQYIIVSKANHEADGLDLWMYHKTGGSGVQITPSKGRQEGPAHNALGAVVSSDNRYIYYALHLGDFFSFNVLRFPLWQIVRRDLLTGEEDIITDAPGSAIRPVLSPDDSKLVYGTRSDTQTGLRIRDLSTGEEHWLKYSVQRDEQESIATRDLLPGYAFTPDGKYVVASYGGKIHRIEVATGADQLIPFSVAVSKELGPQLNFPTRVEEGPVRARIIQDPSESPDGKRLAFSAFTHLYVMDIPDGKPVRVTSTLDREFQPAWSPDGKWLAYVTWSDSGGQIWKVPADGRGVPQQLTRVAAFYQTPVWSPDGSRIVALRSSRQERVEDRSWGGPITGLELVWIPAAGGDARLIVPARGERIASSVLPLLQFGRPHFTSDKDRIFVQSARGLISMRFDGTDQRTHVRVVGKGRLPEPALAEDVRLSPQGTEALVLLTNQLYLIPVPLVGGEAPTVNLDSPSVPVKKLSDVGADYFGWAEGGRSVTWAIGSSFFRQARGSITFESQEEFPGDETGESRKRKNPPPQEIVVNVEQRRHQPSGSIVLRGANVITMRDDEVIKGADLVVTNNRIAAVGSRGSAAIPADAKILDVTGATIIPGMIDTHAHWLDNRRGVLDLKSWDFLATLAYGITTGRDPQSGTNDIFLYSDLIETGELLGPRAYSTGPGVFSDTNFKSLEDAENVVTRYKKYYRTKNLKSYDVGNRRQRQWVVEACKRLEMMPTTEGNVNFKLDLTHVIDGFSGNEHSLPVLPLYKDVVDLVARSGIFYTPTLLVDYGGPWAENYFYETTDVHDDAKVRRFIPHNVLDTRTERRSWFRSEEYTYAKHAADDAKIIAAGGKVCIGSHGQLQGIGYHWEMWALQSGGLRNIDVLRAATIRGAEAIGYPADLGSIEVGKLADIVVLAKDPLENIRNTNTVRYVMKNGELFDGDTLNEIWPRQKALAPLWWWNDYTSQ